MFQLFLYVLIVLFSVSSYFFAGRNIRRGVYKPNAFSRGVWGLLSINSFAGVAASRSSIASYLFSGVIMCGSLMLFGLSLKQASVHIGKLEYASIVLILISIFIWIFFHQPLLNIAMSLFAHFIGALPTYKRVWYEPQSESRVFWGLFFIASVLSVIASFGVPLSKQVIPLYFTFFDGGLFLLSTRKTSWNKYLSIFQS